MSLVSLERGSANPAEFLIAAPALGAEFSLTVPAGLRYRLETLFLTFTTSATVANRILKIDIKDPTNLVWEGGQPTALVASTTYRFGGARLGPAVQSAGGGVPLQFFLPDLWIPPGFVITSNTGNIDVAGDQYSAVRLMITVSSDQD